MSIREINQIEILEKLKRKEMKQATASEMMGISVRQVRRKLKRYVKCGVKSLIHQNRGKDSKRKINQSILDKAMDVIREKYTDFSPTLAHEKLTQNHNFNLSRERLRQEMIISKIWTPKRKKKCRVYQSRERRDCLGELVQLDGSPHYWFEDRGKYCNLNVCIDDATGKIALSFSKTETSNDYFVLLKKYILEHGVPVSLYVDKHSIFRNNTPANLDLKKPDGNNPFEGLTQFGRAVKELGIYLIFANTPQAKGRVERANQTLQDRLVKELRLNNISDITKANQFVDKFAQDFNNKFGVKPKSNVDMHKKLDSSIDLDKILCIKEYRVLSRNLTCQYHNCIFQINTHRSPYTLRRTTVEICEQQDGSITLHDRKGNKLDFTVIKNLVSNRTTNSKLIGSRNIWHKRPLGRYENKTQLSNHKRKAVS